MDSCLAILKDQKNSYTLAIAADILSQLAKKAINSHCVNAIIGALSNMLISKNEDVQCSAVRELDQLVKYVSAYEHVDAIIDELFKILKDQGHKAQFSAAQVLSQLAEQAITSGTFDTLKLGDGIIVKLIRILTKGKSDVQTNAAWALGHIAKKTKYIKTIDIMNTMLRHLSSPNYDVQDQVKNVLQKLSYATCLSVWLLRSDTTSEPVITYVMVLAYVAFYNNIPCTHPFIIYTDNLSAQGEITPIQEQLLCHMLPQAYQMMRRLFMNGVVNDFVKESQQLLSANNQPTIFSRKKTVPSSLENTKRNSSICVLM